MSGPIILHAQASSAAAEALRSALADAGAARAILLADEALASDPERNQIARDALRHAALGQDPEGGLILVAIADAQAPLGLRDIQRLPWSPGAAEEGAQLAAIRAALAPAPMAPSAARDRAAPSAPQASPAPKRRSGARTAIFVLLGVFAVVAAFFFVSSSVFMRGDITGGDPKLAEPAPSEEQAPAQMAPSPSLNREYGEQIQAQLAQVAAVMASQGLQQVGSPHIDALPSGATRAVPATLAANTDYAIVGVCDRDCDRLELVLRDSSGAELMRRFGGEDAPVLVIRPEATGAFSVDVTMNECTVSPCYFALQLYGRVAPADSQPPIIDAPAEPPSDAQEEPPPETRAQTQTDLAPIQQRLDAIASDVAELKGRPPVPMELVFGTLALISAQFVAILVLAFRKPRGAAQQPSHPISSSLPPLPIPADGKTYFASYARADSARVDPILGEIEKSGVPIWLDRVDIGGGTTWSSEIVQAIRGARGMILFCSPNAFNSDHVLREVDLASTFHKHLVPIMLEPAPVPDAFFYYLSTRQIIDVSAENEWRARVLSSLNVSV